MLQARICGIVASFGGQAAESVKQSSVVETSYFTRRSVAEVTRTQLLHGVLLVAASGKQNLDKQPLVRA